MTDLLTKEERETVEQVSEILRSDIHHKNTYQDAGLDLLNIIDNLSKRGVKKYSKEELREFMEYQFNNWPGGLTEDEEHIAYCAAVLWGRHSGVLEEKQ